MQIDYIKTGITGLDELIHNGIPKGNGIILEGPAGVGKTTFGIQWLYMGAKLFRESGMYITFEEHPIQIYRDMKQFGWNLQQLEESNQLRVVSLSPSFFIKEIFESNGLVEKLLDDIDCKRVVIDSISLLKYEMASVKEQRDTIYSIRNAFAKKGINTLFLREHDKEDTLSSFVHYLLDGVIQLSFESRIDNSKIRCLEIRKLRGTKFVEGSHIYRILDDGIKVLKSLKIPTPITDSNVIPTGIEQLDYYLGGGFTRGSNWLLEFDSSSNYKNVFVSIFKSMILHGENMLCRLSLSTQISELAELMIKQGVDFKDLINKENLIFLEQFNRPIQEEYKKAVITLHHIPNDEYINYILEQTNLDHRIKKGSWFLYYDINAGVTVRGKQFVIENIPKVLALEKSLGLTVLIGCNIEQMDEDILAILRRKADGIIKIWVDDYQYLKVNKSINGVISEPLIMQRTNIAPFIDLL